MFKKLFLAVLFFYLGVFISTGQAGSADSRIIALSLFKNGLTFVKQEIVVDKPGEYVLKNVPAPIHGTFWIEARENVKVRAAQIMLDEETFNFDLNLEDAFAGHDVKIYLKDRNLSTLQGKVLRGEDFQQKQRWDREYQPSYYYYESGNEKSDNNRSGRLILKTEKGIIYLMTSEISYIESDALNSTIKKKVPVLIFSIDKSSANNKSSIYFSYLTKGLAWVPAYKITLKDDKTLAIEQNAIIKNELRDFHDSEIQVISGFPNIQFAQVISPLSLSTTWSQFFQQLNRRPEEIHDTMSNVVTQQAISANDYADASSLALPELQGEGVDIHYQSLGKISMREGEAMVLPVEKKEGEYEKIVEWLIPDNRDEWGRTIDNSEKFADDLWDSLRFRNPFSFPMTTAVASIYRDDKFLGQSTSYWVNPQGETLLHITKALSMSSHFTEVEVKGEREKIRIGSRDFQKSQIESQLFVKNYRKSETRILIQRKFSGKLISAEGNPQSRLLEVGVYSVNERHQLTWEFILKPGEEKTLKFDYSVLVYY